MPEKDAAEIKITPSMIRAGVEVLADSGDAEPSQRLVQRILEAALLSYRSGTDRVPEGL